MRHTWLHVSSGSKGFFSEASERACWTADKQTNIDVIVMRYSGSRPFFSGLKCTRKRLFNNKTDKRVSKAHTTLDLFFFS